MEHVKDPDDFPQLSNHSDVEYSYASTVYQDFPDTATVDSDIRESQNDTIVQALDDLQTKINRLECERQAAQESLSQFHKHSLSNILPNFQDNFELDSSFIAQSNELESQLTMAETRCRTLEKQLEYIRAVMHSVQQDTLQETGINDEDNNLINNGSIFNSAIMLTQPSTQHRPYTVPASTKSNDFASFISKLPTSPNQAHTNSSKHPHINSSLSNNENESKSISQKINKISFMQDAAMQTSFLNKNSNADDKNLLFRPAVPLKPPQRLPESAHMGGGDFSGLHLLNSKLLQKDTPETSSSQKEISKPKPSIPVKSVKSQTFQPKTEPSVPSKSVKPRSKFTCSERGQKTGSSKPAVPTSNRSESCYSNVPRSKSAFVPKEATSKSKSVASSEHKEKALVRVHGPKTKNSRAEHKKPALTEPKRKTDSRPHSAKMKINASAPKKETQSQKSVQKSKINNHYHLNMADIPFVVGQCTGPSSSLPANIQGVVSLLKNHNSQICSDKANITGTRAVVGTGAASCLEDVLKMLEEEFQQISLESGKLSQKLGQMEYAAHRQALTKRLNKTVQQLDVKSLQISKLQALHDQIKSKKQPKQSSVERLTTAAGNSETIQIVTTVKPSISGSIPIEVEVKKPNRKTIEHKNCPILGDKKVKIHNENAKVLQQMKHLQHSLNRDTVMGKIT